MMTTIVIRTDVGGHHGMGHAVRMCALANELEKYGDQVTFATTTRHALEQMTKFTCVHWVYDDGYVLDADIYILDTKQWYLEDEIFIKSQKAKGKKIIWIDRQEVHPSTCDMVIAPNMHWKHHVIERIYDDFGDNFLYGSGYVMLAKEVSETEPTAYEYRIKNTIVFCAGGSDPSGALQRMHDWTEDIDLDRGILIFAHPHGSIPSSKVRRKTATVITPFQRSLLRNASLVVGMFGVTPYECLYYQTPMLVMGHTQENVLGAEILTERSHGGIECMRHIDDMRPAVFRDVITSYWGNRTERIKMSQAAQSIKIDGDGVLRAAYAIMGTFG